jgi:hypothetical protein
VGWSFPTSRPAFFPGGVPDNRIYFSFFSLYWHYWLEFLVHIYRYFIWIRSRAECIKKCKQKQFYITFKCQFCGFVYDYWWKKLLTSLILSLRKSIIVDPDPGADRRRIPCRIWIRNTAFCTSSEIIGTIPVPVPKMEDFVFVFNYRAWF